MAEDDESIRTLFKDTLETYGYRVIPAVDGADAIEKFMADKDKIQMLLFDVIMPRKNGKQAFHEIQNIAHDIKIFFMSGYTCDALQTDDIAGKEVNFVWKPISPMDILRKVREILDS